MTQQQYPHPAPVDELAMLVRRLVQSLRKDAPDNDLADQALDYLKRYGFGGTFLRDVPGDVPAGMKPSKAPEAAGTSPSASAPENVPALRAALEDAKAAINSMKVEAETAAQGDEQMMLEACEQISTEGLAASLAIDAVLAAAPTADALGAKCAACFFAGCCEHQAIQTKADRYDYLRERDLDTLHMGGVFAGKTPDNVVLNGEDLDAAIDAALADQAAKG